jgi:hypothetical protein
MNIEENPLQDEENYSQIENDDNQEEQLKALNDNNHQQQLSDEESLLPLIPKNLL